MFGIGSVVCALAPSMEVLLVGRTLQGTAGGLLAGLGYALINTALAAIVVDQGFGAGVGDVGGRDSDRDRRPAAFSRSSVCGVGRSA